MDYICLWNVKMIEYEKQYEHIKRWIKIFEAILDHPVVNDEQKANWTEQLEKLRQEVKEYELKHDISFGNKK